MRKVWPLWAENLNTSETMKEILLLFFFGLLFLTLAVHDIQLLLLSGTKYY